ncbi:MAG: hypothetical protein ACC655_07165 [Rhodothermia bacterium]
MRVSAADATAREPRRSRRNKQRFLALVKEFGATYFPLPSDLLGLFMRMPLVFLVAAVLSVASIPVSAQPQLAWYWYEIAQNDSVAGGDLVVELKVASDRVAPPQNRLRSATLDLLFDMTEVQFTEALISDLMAHDDSTNSYSYYHTLAPAPGDSMMRLTAFSFLDDADLEELGFVIGFDPVSIAKYRFTIKPPGLTLAPPRLETVAVSAVVTFLDFLECTPDGYDGCTMELGSPAAGPSIYVSAKLLLEGAHVSPEEMSAPSAFLNSIPLSQPFADPVYDGTPFEYDSLVTLASIPSDMIDWVLVSLRTGPEADTEVLGSRGAAVLRNDGRIVTTTGETFSFPSVQPGNYFMVVRQRNHMAVMTAITVDVNDGLGLWDFSSAQSQAFSLDGNPMQDMGDGSFALLPGDANLDGQVTVSDFNIWLQATKSVATGYQLSDFDMDGQVTASDFNVWLKATKAVVVSQVPE